MLIDVMDYYGSLWIIMDSYGSLWIIMDHSTFSTRGIRDQWPFPLRRFGVFYWGTESGGTTWSSELEAEVVCNDDYQRWGGLLTTRIPDLNHTRFWWLFITAIVISYDLPKALKPSLEVADRWGSCLFHGVGSLRLARRRPKLWPRFSS